MNKKNTLNVIIVVVFLLATSFVFSQTPPNRQPPPPPGVPLDGGIFILIASAVGIAYKKLRNRD